MDLLSLWTAAGGATPSSSPVMRSVRHLTLERAADLAFERASQVAAYPSDVWRISISRTIAAISGLCERVVLDIATCNKASAIGVMPLLRASVARSRMTSRAGAGGSAKGPSNTMLATRLGCDAAMCWQMIVPIE